MSDSNALQPDNSDDRDHLLESVIADYIRACETGTAPNRSDILERHPAFADELRRFFGQHDRMNQIAAPIRGFGDSLAQSVGPGQQLSYVGNYELLEEIARGGMGVVYKARQTTLGRVVAVKMIVSGRLASEQDVQRFQVEAQAAAGLQHPNIVSIHEVGQHEGWHYFSMDYVDGRDLSKILRENLLSAKQAATYVRQMAEAIHYAHQQGTLHRDLKPSNILIDNHDQVRITDFGLAMRVECDSDLTRTGQIVGTPSYMPPEQAQGKRSLIGPGSDVYSLGAVLYECLTGRAPFRADSVLKTIEQVIQVEAASPRLLNPGVARDLETICLMCLQKEPHRRFGTAQLLAEDLGRYLRGEPIIARPISRPSRLWRWCRRKPVVASLTALLLLALVAVTATSSLAYMRELAHRHEIEGKNTEIGRALEDEHNAKEDATQRLYRSLVAQARANRLSRRIGQRFQSLEVMTEASRMAREMALPETDFVELRHEAIACMALPDLRVAKEWGGWPAGSLSIDFDYSCTRYARTDRQGAVSIRPVADDAEIMHMPGIGVTTQAWPRLSRDGQFLAVGHTGGRMRMWKLDGTEPVLLVDDPSGLHHSSDFSPDNRLFAFGGGQGPISIIELSTGKVIRQLGVGSSLTGLAFHPYEPRFAVCVNKTTIRICDVESGHLLSELLQAEGVDGIAWHPDGKTLAAVGNDHKINLLNAVTGEPGWVLEGHNNGGINLTFNNAGNLLASTDWNSTLRLWDPVTGQQVFHTQARFYLPRFHSDDRLLAIQIDGEKLKLLEVAAAREYRTLVRGAAFDKTQYQAPSISPDGRLLAVGMSDGFGLWDLTTGDELVIVQEVGRTSWLHFEGSGSLLTNSVEAGLLRWPIQADLTTLGAVKFGPPQRLLVPGSDFQIASSRDGRVLASAQSQGGIVLHADRSDQPIRLGPHNDARYIAVSPDGHLVATGSHNGTEVRVWDAKSGQLVKELPADGWRVGFSPDGKWLATNGGGGRGCRLWAIGTWEKGTQLSGTLFAFSPDGKVIAVETGHGGVRLVDPNTGREFARLEDPNQDIVWPLFSPDGTQLVTTSQSNTNSIHIWDLRSIRQQLTAMDLDWDLPAYPPSDKPSVVEFARIQAHEPGRRTEFLRIQLQGAQHSGPLNVTVDLGELAFAKQANTHSQQGRTFAGLLQWDKAIAEYIRALELSPNHVQSHNNLAWLLATCSDANFRDPTAAVEHARRAVELDPNAAHFWNTLGTAHYRAGDWHAAIESLEKAEELSPGKYFVANVLFLALAHWQLDEKQPARKWFDQASEWMEKNQSRDDELQRFRAEAAELLGSKDYAEK